MTSVSAKINSPLRTDPKSSSWCYAAELFAIFIFGVTLMSFLQSGRGGVNGNSLAVAGHDSFYHIKMAMLLPELGLVDSFPWLTTTIFEDNFVSHHYGFHVLLVPFIRASEWLGSGDPLEGGRWGIAFFFGIATVLFDGLLIVGGVRYRPLWWLMFLVMPHQFFSRHVFIRAICPSLVFMLAMLLAMFRQRWIVTAVIIFVYIQVYLGAVMFAPLLVMAYFVACMTGASGERISWRMPAIAFVGWLAGILLHPYGGWEVFDFLRVQIWGTGLNPDIPTGREWRSYSSAWFFTRMSAVTLLLSATAIGYRLRSTQRCDMRAICLIIVSFAFLALTLKARRFIEYWPIFSLLSSAYLFAPSAKLGTNIDEQKIVRACGPNHGYLLSIGLYVLFLTTSIICVLFLDKISSDVLFVAWPTWLVVLALLCLPSAIIAAINRSRSATGAAILRTLIIVVSTVVLVVSVVSIGMSDRDKFLGVTNWREWFAGAIGICSVVVWLVLWKRKNELQARANSEGLPQTAVVVGGAGLMLAAILISSSPLVAVQRSARCKFDLAAISGVMDYLKANSQPEDIVFTDDWDVFGLYFFYNHHNRYVVGLDPKFTHERDPILWERYVAITRAKTPSKVSTEVISHDGERHVIKADVRLADIRTYFKASWVIVDDEHIGLANQLDGANELATRVYTSSQKTSKGKPRYTVYRMTAADEPSHGESK